MKITLQVLLYQDNGIMSSFGLLNQLLGSIFHCDVETSFLKIFYKTEKYSAAFKRFTLSATTRDLHVGATSSSHKNGNFTTRENNFSLPVLTLRLKTDHILRTAYNNPQTDNNTQTDKILHLHYSYSLSNRHVISFLPKWLTYSVEICFCNTHGH